MIQELGEGQYGSVVLAQLKKDYRGLPKNSKVAIKLIGSDALTARDVEQISREIGVLKELSPENDCNIDVSCYYNYFTTTINGQKYIVIVMEYIPGVQLAKQIKTVPEDKIVQVMKTLARTLGYLHSRKIVHKDIKPENIMITPEGVLKYIDFGFACLMISGHENSCRKDIKGSPVYISPERFEIVVNELQPSDEELYKIYKTADVWALGMVFYELLFKKLPPQVNRANNLPELVKAYLQSEPIAFPTGDPRLVAIVKGMMEKDSSQRSTIDEVISELNAPAHGTGDPF